jgi:hypothetical protein
MMLFIVFLNSPHRETPKNVIEKNREEVGLGFFRRSYCKMFFCSACVFELPSLRNTRKHDKTKKSQGKTDIEIFVDLFWERFSTGLFTQNIVMMFLNSPYRETPKNVLRTKKQVKKKKSAGVWVVWDLANCAGNCARSPNLALLSEGVATGQEQSYYEAPLWLANGYKKGKKGCRFPALFALRAYEAASSYNRMPAQRISKKRRSPCSSWHWNTEWAVLAQPIPCAVCFTVLENTTGLCCH